MTSPSSDVDFAIICKNATDKKYLKLLTKNMHKLNNKDTFRLCDQMTPSGSFLGEYLLGTVEDYKKFVSEVKKSKGDNTRKEDVAKELSKRLHVNGGNSDELSINFEDIVGPQYLAEKSTKEIALIIFNSLMKDGLIRNDTMLDAFNIKEDVIRRPSKFIEGCWALSGIGEMKNNSLWQKLEILKDNGIIASDLADNIKKMLEMAYKIRYAAHLQSKLELDTIYFKRPDFLPEDSDDYKKFPYLILEESSEDFGGIERLEGDLLFLVRTMDEVNFQVKMQIAKLEKERKKD